MLQEERTPVGERLIRRLQNYGKSVLGFYREEDLKLLDMLPHFRVCGSEFEQIPREGVLDRRIIHSPSERWGMFLHEAAIVEFGGVLFASFYVCPKDELCGYTPIIGRRSYDGGKTWSEPELIAHDPEGKILYCPPVYGVDEGKLYMLVNEMVGPDLIHSLDLYVLDPESDRFTLLWSRPIPFKLNTNVVRLQDGRLVLPGRVGALDAFPNTPAVLISDSGKMDGEWRVVKVAQNGNLPDGEQLVHPEMTIIVDGAYLHLLGRNDNRRTPLMYLSNDLGETWSVLYAHNLPYIASKIYSGTLSTGEHYVVANEERYNRSLLVLYLSDVGDLYFRRRLVLFDGEGADASIGASSHYPSAVEYDGKLYIIATIGLYADDFKTRGAILYTVDLSQIL